MVEEVCFQQLVKAGGHPKASRPVLPEYWVMLHLSISDVRVIQKGSNGDGKQHFFGLDYNFTLSYWLN